jgi:protein TonB
MPRLRVTFALSLWAMLVGILGTGWLSTWTDDWTGPPARDGGVAIYHPPRVVARRRSHAPPHVVGAEPAVTTQAAPAPAPPSLVPLSTPPDPARYADLRGHLDGRVVLDIATDGSGRVTAASIARTSGDSVLDAYALATVRRWRFAVPADAAGVHGQLPMRFDSRAHVTPP